MESDLHCSLEEMMIDTFDCVILIDMQRSYLSALDDDVRSRLIDAHLLLLDACKRQDIPLVILEYAGSGSTISLLEERARTVPRLHRFTKDADDGFFGSGLGKFLEELEIQTLVMAGINASFCVKSTARSALNRGYTVKTADVLIADPPRYTSLRKSVDWFRKNCTFYE
jgi:nicotinamidase-related amidase